MLSNSFKWKHYEGEIVLLQFYIKIRTQPIKTSVSVKTINPVFCGEEKEVQSNLKFTELSVHCRGD